MPDPLSPEEVAALELDGSLESSVKYKQRYIDTIHDRERKRDELHEAIHKTGICPVKNCDGFTFPTDRMKIFTHKHLDWNGNYIHDYLRLLYNFLFVMYLTTSG